MKMKKKMFLVISLLLFLGSVSTEIYGQQAIVRILQLDEALANGNVTLTARGNNSSSGSSVYGTLRNNTSNEININITLNNGLYLRNSGSGQNMIATQIFLSNGEYSIYGTNSFISLSANVEIQIMFTAYCADFELDNPRTTETFSRSSMPSGFQSIASKISRYENDNFDKDLVTPIQVALWRAQGHSRATIATKFSFTNNDWEIATIILNY
jgi:hypothetical protein